MSRAALGRLLPAILAALAAAVSAPLTCAQSDEGIGSAIVDTDGAWSLEKCIVIALQNSPQVAIAAATVASAEASVDRSRSGYYPQASLDASVGERGTLRGGSTPAAQSTSSPTSASLSLDWTFWETGRQESVAESRLALNVSRLDREALLQSLVESVAVSYYAVLAARELVYVAEDGVAAATLQLDSVRGRIEAGKAAEVDIHTAEVDLANAELDLIDARTGERLALAQLRNVMGLDHTVDVRVAPAPIGTDWLPPSLDEAVAQARATRPDLMADEGSVQISSYALERARQQRRPTFRLGGAAAYSSSAGSRASAQWSLTARMQWSLFDGYARRADERRAEASLWQARESLRQAELRVGLEVEEALIEVERTTQRIRASEASLAAAAAQLQAARDRYDADKGILLQVTDARAAFTAAAANLVRARFDRQIALIAVRRAMGTLPVPHELTDTEAALD